MQFSIALFPLVLRPTNRTFMSLDFQLHLLNLRNPLESTFPCFCAIAWQHYQASELGHSQISLHFFPQSFRGQYLSVVLIKLFDFLIKHRNSLYNFIQKGTWAQIIAFSFTISVIIKAFSTGLLCLVQNTCTFSVVLSLGSAS